MDYKNISSFLEKFRKIIYEKEEVNNIILLSISKNIGFDLDKKLIKINNNFIYIKASPIVLNEIMTKKQNILFDIKKLLPNSNFKDIR